MKLSSIMLSILFAFIGIFVVGQIYLPIPILTEIDSQFGSGIQGAGYVSSAFSVAYAMGFLISGPLSDRYGRRKIMILGFSLFTLTTYSITFINKNFQYLLILRAFQGLTASSYPPLILAYINEKFEKMEKVRAVSFMALGFLTASILAQLFSIYFRKQLFNEIEHMLLPFYLISLIIIVIFINPNQVNNNKQNLTDIYKQMPSILTDSNLKWIYISTLCTLSVLVAFYILMDYYYGYFFSLNKINPITTRAISLPAMFLSLFAPRMIKKIGGVRLLRLSFFISFIGLIFSSFAVFLNSTYGLLAASVLFIIGRSFSVPSLVNSIGVYCEPNIRGTSISIYTFILFIGASIGPVLAHALEYMTYQYALIILAIIVIIPILLTFNLDEYSDFS